MSRIDSRKDRFVHPSGRHEGPTELGLRFACEQNHIPIITPIHGIELTPLTRTFPDLQIVWPRDIYVYDSGAPHFKPKQIDDDRKQRLLLAALGAKTFTFLHHTNRLNIDDWNQAVAIMKEWRIRNAVPEVWEWNAQWRRIE